MNQDAEMLEFRPIDTDSMERIMPYLKLHTERSCDFSYGGLLMWVDMFKYEYAIHNDTLYIKGLTPGDGEHMEKRVSFSFPLGSAPLAESIALLKSWCDVKGIPLVFSSVTPQGVESLMKYGGRQAIELISWEDYIYDASQLATLVGKKMSKKRNHVNQFKAHYPDYEFQFMSPEDIKEIRNAINKDIAQDASQSEEAQNELKLSETLLAEVEKNNKYLFGAILKTEGKIVAYTIGDIINDTLFVHVEKAERNIIGSFEMINHCFAAAMVSRYPNITFINREDDAGDPGLRLAKQSYHPLYLLKKFNVLF